ncbi:anti-repressor SinI family protein [Cohnella kolymensis]|uniref:anti-repressor SinI family protein n=1 Tax=Cohnella kolymensis TaxID=1590652 RepID=UPI0009E22061|nr:anti-repressor SinI family protein [Cohnella kolymensis]
MSVTKSMDIEELDLEWIDLMLTARNMGLSIEEVRAFLRESGEPRSDQEASRR